MLDAFIEATEHSLPGYQHAYFSFVAIRRGEAFTIAQGRLHLGGVPAQIISKSFQSANLRAGMYKLQELKLTARDVISTLLQGVFRAPDGDIHFPAEEGRAHSIHFIPFHPDGDQFNRRQMQLYVQGEKRQTIIESVRLDWELRAAETPFDGLQDLCAEYFVGPITGDYVGVEILAFNVIQVNANSVVNGTKAQLAVLLADGLDQAKATLGYIAYGNNRVVARGMINGQTMAWKHDNSVAHGEAEIEVPPGTVLHCYAAYAGQAQHHYWVGDPSTSQNPLRAVHQAFDRNLEVLQGFFDRDYVKGQDAREFEVGVAWLLWMLGFSVIHLGKTAKTTNGPDLIARSPNGHFLVVECTTGLLKADNKLSELVARTERVRTQLSSSGYRHLRARPAIVTTKTRDEVRADLEQAQKLGVLVTARDSFNALIGRSLVAPDADRFFAEAEQAIDSAQRTATI